MNLVHWLATIEWLTKSLLISLALVACTANESTPTPISQQATPLSTMTKSPTHTPTPADTTEPTQTAIPDPCASPPAGTQHFLALGDSYTIGESVEERERWPVQLANLLRESGFDMADPTIVATTGWTTSELLNGIDRRTDLAEQYELVSLLIGVNNQYRGQSQDTYREEFVVLLNLAIGFAGGDPGRVIVLSIPDWGVTPFAANRDRDVVGAEIDQFNAINQEESEKAGVFYVDVTPISREASSDLDLIAPDGLHPSGKMYGEWARLAYPAGCQALVKW